MKTNFDYWKKENKPVILIKGFGGIVDKIAEFINGKKVEELTFEYQSKVNPKLKQFLDENPKIKEKIKFKYNELLNTLNLQKEKIITLEFNNYHQIIADILKTFHKISK